MVEHTLMFRIMVCTTILPIYTGAVLVSCNYFFILTFDCYDQFRELILDVSSLTNTQIDFEINLDCLPYILGKLDCFRKTHLFDL